MTAREITNEQKLECARRELAMRKRVYPRWVEAGRMSLPQSVHQIACMEAIVADYEKAAEKERLI